MGFCDTNFSSSAASDVGDVCQLRRRPSGANFALSLAPPLLPLLRPLLTLVINGQPEEGDVAARVQPQPEKTVDRLFLKQTSAGCSTPAEEMWMSRKRLGAGLLPPNGQQQAKRHPSDGTRSVTAHALTDSLCSETIHKYTALSLIPALITSMCINLLYTYTSTHHKHVFLLLMYVGLARLHGLGIGLICPAPNPAVHICMGGSWLVHKVELFLQMGFDTWFTY